MNPPRIRILVVDDHFMVRLGLIGAISTEPDIEVVGEAANGADALECFERFRPDITLMDGMLPDIHGVEVTRRILGFAPDARVILVSINETAEDIHRAMEAGAWGYIPKSSEKDAIVHAIRTVAEGKRFLSREFARRLAERKSMPLLSPRETDVLRLIAQGMANKQIADELVLGEATVKTHVCHILDKLGVPDRTRAVTLAIERGLLRM